MNRNGDQHLGRQTEDGGPQTAAHNSAVKIQIFPFILIFDPGHGPAGGFIVIVYGHSTAEAALMPGAVVAVFNGGRSYLLAAFSAERAFQAGKLRNAGGADQSAFGKDDAAADRTAAGVEEIQKEGMNGGRRRDGDRL